MFLVCDFFLFVFFLVALQVHGRETIESLKSYDSDVYEKGNFIVIEPTIETLINQANLLLRKNELEDALEEFQAILKFLPNKAELYCQCAAIFVLLVCFYLFFCVCFLVFLCVLCE